MAYLPTFLVAESSGRLSHLRTVAFEDLAGTTMPLGVLVAFKAVPPLPRPLTDEERAAIVLAVQSAFTKLRNLYHQVEPIFASYGFSAPSPGVLARDFSEKIEASLVQHCPTFSKGAGHGDLQRDSAEWEVKICKDSGLTINQSKVIHGENYIVVNYRANTQVTKIWVLWNAQDHFFSSRRSNSNARAFLSAVAQNQIEVLQVAPAPTKAHRPKMATATLRKRRAKAG